MSREVFWGLAAVVCLSLSGCGSKSDVKYKIAVIPKGLTHQHWESVHRGAERAAADLKALGIPVEIIWDGPRKESDSQEQIAIIDRLPNRGVHGMVLAPQDKKSMVDPVARTVDQKIPVVIIDSGLDEEETRKNPDLFIKYVATDNYNGGKMAGAKLLEILTKEGKNDMKVALFRYQPGSESTEQREKGFLDAIRAAKDKGAKVTVVSDEKYAGATVDTALKEAGPWVRQLKKAGVQGVFAVNESATHGLLMALRTEAMVGSTAEKEGEAMRLVGFDSSETLIRAVHDGDVQGLVVQDPYAMGYLAVWTLVRHLEGDDVSAGGKYLGTGEHFLTKDNVDSEEMRGRYLQTAQAQRTIEKPEFKKK
jgi:ribose transport system substrate-binding protein